MKCAWLASLALLSGVEACAALPDIPTGECGNGVIDQDEDCDSFAPTRDSVCRTKGSVGECHLDCSRLSSGARNPCPADWGCNLDGICRPLSGDFEPRVDTPLGNGGRLMSSDFDRDGRDDLVSLEPFDTLGRTRLRFHYFDERGALAQSVQFPKLLFSPVIADLAGDGQRDVLFSDGRIGLLLEQDRSWVPKTFGSYWLPNSRVRMVAVYDNRVSDASAVVALTTLTDQPPGFYVPNGPDALRLVGELPGPLASLIGDPVSGNVIESATRSPCDESVLAVRGAEELEFVDFCTLDAKEDVIWRARVQAQRIALSPPAPIDAAPQIVDMNGDGHLDVLLGAGGRPYVALGDGQGLGSATPYRLELANPSETDPEIPMPLAVGDFTGDGLVDFVFPDHLLVSLPAASGNLPRYVLERAHEGGTWTEAKIADLNGNGKLDVAAASSARPNIDFFNGTGTQHPTVFNLATNGPVRGLSIGDFDGDLVSDLAFAESSASSSRPDSLMIAFGNLAGSPAAPAAIARISGVEQLSVFEEAGIGNLMVASSETRGNADTGVLTLLEGSGDRSPIAPYALTLFAGDGTLAQSTALSFAAGAFTSPGQRDVLTLASPDLSAKAWEFWLLPDLYSGASIPVRLQAKFDPHLVPARLGGPGQYAVHVNLASVAADLDGEGRDEAVFAMPNDTQGCGLVFAGTQDDDRVELLTLMLAESCERPQLAAADVDADGAMDIVLLTGGPGRLDAKLLVFWNDGHGSFSTERITRVSAPEDSPVEFTIFRPVAKHSRLAYVTESAARLVTASASPRAFEPAETLALLEHGTGIVAADVDGDGAEDVAFADSGTLGLRKAALEAAKK